MPSSTRRPEVYVSEVEFKRMLRVLGISSSWEWEHWCASNNSRRRQLHLPLSPAKAYENLRFWEACEATYPKVWKQYLSTRRLRAARDQKDADPESARFAVRYRAATGYRGIRFSGIGEDTVSAYSAGFGVLLAYSALEACCKATGNTVSKVSIIDPLLAGQFRAIFDKTGQVIHDEITNTRLKRKFARFLQGKDDDIIPCARSISHLFAHGILTPWGLGVVSLKVAVVCDRLAQELLSHSDRLFAKKLRYLSLGERS
jgi:hypothetical protein